MPRRYANDLGLAYETIKQSFRIYAGKYLCIIYFDGYTINYLGNKILPGKLLLKNIKTSFKLPRQNQWWRRILFVVSNHGDEQKRCYLSFGVKKNIYTLDSITQYLAQIPCRKMMVILGQCYAGKHTWMESQEYNYSYCKRKRTS